MHPKPELPSNELSLVPAWDIAENINNLSRLGKTGRYNLPNGEIFTITDAFTYQEAKEAQCRCISNQVLTTKDHSR